MDLGYLFSNLHQYWPSSAVLGQQSARRGGEDGGLLGEVDEGDRQALRVGGGPKGSAVTRASMNIA